MLLPAKEGKQMKESLKTKFVVMTFVCVLLTAIAIGSTSFITANSIIEQNSNSIITLTSLKNAQTLNTVLTGIEQSVIVPHSYAENMFAGINEYKQSPQLLDEYMEAMNTLLKSAAENTDGAVSAYIRFAPELGLHHEGTLLIYYETGNPNPSDDEYDEDMPYAKPGFYPYPVTDIPSLQFSKETMWYFAPKIAGSAQWIDPYIETNRTKELYVISYVIPIIIDQTFVGVVGMDIDMKLFTDTIDKIKVYETGSAFLCNNKGEIIYNKNYPDGITDTDYETIVGMDKETLKNTRSNAIVSTYSRDSGNIIMSVQPLENGMILVHSIPSSEITVERSSLMTKIVILLFIALAASFGITMITVSILFKPIAHLTEVSKQIASGDLEVQIQCKSKDEIGTLANSFKTTVAKLKELIEKINKQAYTDAPTGVGNKAAYFDAIKRIEVISKHSDTNYAVFVMDINYLKMYNDRRGHEFGDMLISDASEMIHRVFGKYELFRIGGDEFVCIIFNNEEGLCEQLKREFKELMDKFNKTSTFYDMGLHIAIGYGEYMGAESEESFNDVFTRADKDMYLDKLEIKKDIEIPEDYIDDRTLV